LLAIFAKPKLHAPGAGYTLNRNSRERAAGREANMGWAVPRRAILAVAFATFLVEPASPVSENKDAELTRAATAAVERIERENGFSGVILVARGDQVLLRKAAGFADRERNIRNTPETKFPLESVTKQFTAAATMLLVQDRKGLTRRSHFSFCAPR
jgi:CubicO group peptidase (beta-lactamase class C family)